MILLLRNCLSDNDSLDYDEDLKERLKVSVQELYKRTLSPSYED